MKKFMCVFVVIITMSITLACTSDWVEFDYDNPVAKFKAEQMIKIPDDDRFEDFFECRVWARKRLFGAVVPGTKQEYFEGYIAIPDDFDSYIFIYDLKGDYMHGDYSECKIIDFNDEANDELGAAPKFVGHYKIDKIQIKRR